MSEGSNGNSLIRVVSHNTRGLRNVTIPTLFERFDIILIQETMLCKQDLGSLNSLSNNFFGTGVAVTDTSTGILKGRPKGGVAILWKRSFGAFVTEINFGLDWMTGISLNLPNENLFYIITAYLPYNSHENEDEFLEKLGILISIINDIDSPYIWVLGDFNAHIGKSPTNFGNQFNEACDENELIISDKILLPDNSFTYISDSWNSTSWLDHCISTKTGHELIHNMCIEYDLAAQDHIPISFNIPLNSQIDTIAKTNCVTISEYLDWNNLTPQQIGQYRERTENLLNEIDTPFSALQCSNFNCEDQTHISSYCKYYYSIINAMHSASLPLIEYIRHRPKPFPGWTQYVQEAHAASIAAFRDWRRGGRPKSGRLLVNKKECHRKFKHAVRQAKRNEQNIQQHILAEKLISNNSKDFWKDIRRIKGNSSVSATSINGVSGDSSICNVWKDHYEKLFNCLERPAYRIDDVPRDYTALITSSEIHDHIKSLNSTYSPGPDGISGEHLKNGPALLCRMLSKCFTTMFIHGKLPRKMLDVHLVPVIKDNRGKISSLDNYRPIAKASCLSKLLELCILKRIEGYILVAENQFGFKKKLGTDSCVYVLKEIINKFKSTNTNTFLAFLDASKAFDRVRHDLLFNKLNHAGVPKYIIRLLNNWYVDQNMFSKWKNCISAPFGCMNGVKQGGVLSPYLFIFYYDKLSLTLNNLNVGCNFNTRINHLFYADDLVLISPTKRGLQKLISECETFSRAHSVKFNIQKSKVMILRAKNYKYFEFGDILLNGVAMEQVSTFKYLGHILSNDASDDNDIMKHCRYLYAVGNSIIRKFWYCSVAIKLKLFRVYCGQIYTGQLWHSFKFSSIRKVNTAYNAILRRMLNIPRHQDGVTYSASAMFAKNNVLNFPSLMRKLMYSFLCRLHTSTHSLIKYLYHETKLTSCWWSRYCNIMFVNSCHRL